MAKPDRGTEDKGPAQPRDVSTLYGQAQAEAELLAAFRSGRMHHAWLVSGPRGVGKATLAHRLARFALANPDPHAPAVAAAADLSTSDEHGAVRQIRAGAHTDLVEIVATTTATAAGRARPTIRVEEIRGGLARLHATSGAGGWRVVIIDSADDMNIPAANALLKSLEEPPARTLFLLVSHIPGRLLATIRSRCRRLQLSPLGRDAVRRILAEAMPEPPSDKAMDELVALAGGSAGEAIRLAEEAGLDLARELMALLATLPGLDTARLHRLANRLTGPRADPEFRLFCELLLDWVAEAVRKGETGTPGRFAALEPDGGFAFLTAGTLAPFAGLWENLARVHGQTLGLNLDRKQFLLNAFFALEAASRGQGDLARTA